MMFLALLPLALLSVGSAADWVSVPLRPPSGPWVAALEVSRGRFLLHPQALARRVSATNSCSPALLEVRLWRPSDLRLVENALRERQVCAPCSVEPFQARGLALRDKQSLWRPLRPHRFLAVTLPPVMRFALRRANNDSCPTNWVRDLSGLVLELTGTGGRGRERDIVMEMDLSGLKARNGSQADVQTEDETTDEELRLRDELRRLQALLTTTKGSRAALTSPPPLERKLGVTAVSDCADVRRHGLKTGVYFLKMAARKVVCTSAGALVVLNRTDGSLSFNRNWKEYRRGFGDLTQSNFFLGLDVMSKYTATGDRCMTIALQPMSNELPLRKAQYSQFVIAPESSQFQLSYQKFDGGLTYDAFSYHNRIKFYTPDKTDGNNCAKRFKSGNWFKNCNYVNVFGRYNYTKKPHDGFSSTGLSAQYVDGFFLLRSAFMTLRKAGGDPRALSPVSGIPLPSCPARVGQWTVPETAEYLITAGGAPGGAAPHGNSPSGGRGALVRVRVLLKKGSKLRFLVGCAGGVGLLSGGGGDGTFVADMTRRTLLAAAGGGGGAGWISGGPGRASRDGGKARLAPGISKDVLTTAAAGWQAMKAKLFGSLNATASSGGLTGADKRGGGGGGGFKGGWAAADGGLSGERRASRHSAGGGGGSACGEKLADSCDIEEAGNERDRGVLKIEAYRCF